MNAADSYEGPWLAELTETDFPPQLRELVASIGIEAAVSLARVYGGCQFYVPKVDALLRKKRDQLVRRDKEQLGYKETARKYGLTEVWVRQICDHRDGDDDKQQDLFG